MSNTNKYCFLLVASLLLMGLLSSCLKEDFGDCPRPFQVTVKAFNADQNDITDSGAIEQATLFVFDENNQIFGVYTLTGEEVKNSVPVKIKIDYPGPKSLKFVSWANLDEKVDFAEITSVKQLTDLFVRLKAQAKADVAQSPGDLFFGTLDVPVEVGGTEPGQSHVLPIYRKTASVIITARNLPSADNPATYSFRLRESHNGFDYNGELVGDMVDYLPSVSVNSEGNLVTPIFNTLPTTDGKSYTLDVYKSGELVYSFTQGSDGKPFVPEVGRLLNIIIDFSIDLSVLVEITPWGEIYQGVEY